MPLPLVSILTPSLNQGRWLRDNLASVASQSYPNIEHIIMDGGSTDASRQILAQASTHIIWRSESDRGQSHALNKAFVASKGEFIGWLNSDDAYFDSRAVEVAVGMFHQRPDIDVVYGHAALVNADGLLLHMIWVPPFSYRLLRLHTFIIQPATFIRRSALPSHLANEAFDYAMDRELWLRLARDHRFARINQILAIDRHHLARKGVARLDLARADSVRLAALYDIPRRGASRPTRKALKVVLRLAGLSLLPSALRARFAFRGSIDAAWKLCARQAAVPRAAMPPSGSPNRTRVQPRQPNGLNLGAAHDPYVAADPRDDDLRPQAGG